MSTPVTTKPPDTTDNTKPQRSLASRILTRPEFGAIAAAIAIFIFFFAVAPPFRTLPAFGTVLYASSTIGIVAVGVALLMIGGEFDLSAGVSVVTSALVAALTCFQLSLNVWVGVLVALVVALGVGFLNGYLVVKTGIPSFLITLATFFSLRGINLAVTKGITGTVASDNISDLDGFASAKAIFASDIPLGFMNIKITVIWWLVFTALASWILLRTKTGNWIFAVGGNAGLEVDRAGRLPVEPDCSIAGHPEVFAIGDMVSLDKLPGVAQVAIQEGRYVAKLIKARVRGQDNPEPFTYSDKGSMATIGYRAAVADAFGMKVTGITAYVMWMFIHMLYLIGWGNRIGTVYTWLRALVFSKNRGHRIITFEQAVDSLEEDAPRPTATRAIIPHSQD